MKIQMAMDASSRPKPVHSSAIIASLVRIFNGYLGFLGLINYKTCPASPADWTILCRRTISHSPEYHGDSHGCRFYEDCRKSAGCHLPVDAPNNCWKPHYSKHLQRASSNELDCRFYQNCYESEERPFPSRVPEPCRKPQFLRLPISMLRWPQRNTIVGRLRSATS